MEQDSTKALGKVIRGVDPFSWVPDPLGKSTSREPSGCSAATLSARIGGFPSALQVLGLPWREGV